MYVRSCFRGRWLGLRLVHPRVCLFLSSGGQPTQPLSLDSQSARQPAKSSASPRTYEKNNKGFISDANGQGTDTARGVGSVGNTVR